MVQIESAWGKYPDYEINLQLQYAFPLRGLTVTAFVQGFNLLNRQTAIDQDQLETNLPSKSSET